MVQCSLRSTSTTSNVSVSDSGHSDGSSDITAHIGDINEASPLRSKEPQNRESPEPAEQTSSSDGSEVSAASSNNEDDAISYDSTMQRIRNDVWEKVRQAKQKRKQKKQQKRMEKICYGSPEMSTASTQRKTRIVVADTNNSLQSCTEEPVKDYLAPESRFGSYRKKPLQDIDVPGTAEWVSEVSFGLGRLVIEEHIPADELLLEQAIHKKSFQNLQDEEIDSAFESILAIDLNEPMAVFKEESPSPPLSVSTLDSQPMLGTVTATDHLSNTDRFLSESVLRAKIFGSMESTLFCVPMFLVEKRENEMFERAYKGGIGLDQWNGSLLSRKLKNFYPCYRAEGAHHPAFTLELYPEAECAEANYSHNFLWQPFLHEIIESFYRTGIMRVPDFCVGSDILTALEYFGILYDPDQLLFDSFSTYLRVKLWSEYFTQRESLAAWVTKKLTKSRALKTTIFSTCPFFLEKGSYITVGKLETEVLGGMLSKVPPSSILVHSFFNGGDQQNMEPAENIHSLVRENFCSYFRKKVPGTSASFPKKRTTIHHPDGAREQLELATLYIHLEDPAIFGQEDDSSSSGIEEESEYLYVSDAFDSIGSSLAGCHFLDNPTAMAECNLPAKVRPDRAKIPSCNLPADIKAECRGLDGPESSQRKRPTNTKTGCHDIDTPIVPISCKAALPSNFRPECRNVDATAPPLSSCNSRMQATIDDIEKNTMKRLSDKPITCPGTDHHFNETRFPGDLWASWKPAKSPPCISTSSCSQFKNSEIPDTWMSWNHSTQDLADPSLKSDSMISIIFPPFDPSSGHTTNKQELPLVPVTSDHIYEDLLLQDTDFFFDDRGNKVPVRDNDGKRKSSKVGGPNDDRKGENRKVNFHVDNQLLSYHPSDYVCDVFELFDDPFSVEPEERVAHKGQSLLRLSQDQQQQLRRPRGLHNHGRVQTGQMSNMLDDCSETEDSSTAFSNSILQPDRAKLSDQKVAGTTSGIMSSFYNLVPGIDFEDTPYDEA